MNGVSAIQTVSRFDPTQFRSKVAAEIRHFEFTPSGTRQTRRLDRFAQFAVITAARAIAQSGLDDLNGSHESVAVYIGSALGGIAYGEEQHERFMLEGIKGVAPALALSIFAGSAATNVAIECGFNGPAISNANSCASGAIAIGEAFRLIRSGEADIAIAGGVECPLAPLTFGSFSLIRAMSTRNESPADACRPFDEARDGFVMGEGAGILVLEELAHAHSRGASIRGELVGYASTTDAHHMTVPLPDGREAARAVTKALEDACLDPGEVDYVNAHATGTRLGDAAEAAALQSVFGDRGPFVSGTKACHGHALGASPAIEAAITVMALEHQYLPSTANLKRPSLDCNLNHVPTGGVALPVDVVVSNAFGFGGINAALVFRRAK